jgi:aryl-alcohol dehydrogenase-like predicted oxidoreductase
VAIEDQLAVLSDMQTEGKIHHIGLSKVDLRQVRKSSELIDVAAVQNKYNVSNRVFEEVLRYCELASIAFVPYAPPASGQLAEPDGVLHELATQYSATPAQLAPAWLLHRSPVMMPIPGTSCSARLHNNLATHQIGLTREAMTAIELAATKAHSSEELRGQKPGGGETETDCEAPDVQLHARP